MEWPEAEPDHESAGNRHRGAESGCSLDKGSETESDQQNLQTAVGSDSGDRLFHDFELSRLDRNVIEVDRGQNDPCDFQDSEGHSIGKTQSRQERRHFEEDHRDQHGTRSTRNRAPVWLHLQTGKQREQDEDGKSCHQRGQPPMAERVVDLGPLHNGLLAWGAEPRQTETHGQNHFVSRRRLPQSSVTNAPISYHPLQKAAEPALQGAPRSASPAHFSYTGFSPGTGFQPYLHHTADTAQDLHPAGLE